MSAYTIHAFYAFRIPVYATSSRLQQNMFSVTCYSMLLMHQLYSFTYKTFLNGITHVQQSDKASIRRHTTCRYVTHISCSILRVIE